MGKNENKTKNLFQPHQPLSTFLDASVGQRECPPETFVGSWTQINIQFNTGQRTSVKKQALLAACNLYWIKNNDLEVKGHVSCAGCWMPLSTRAILQHWSTGHHIFPRSSSSDSALFHLILPENLLYRFGDKVNWNELGVGKVGGMPAPTIKREFFLFKCFGLIGLLDKSCLEQRQA